MIKAEDLRIGNYYIGGDGNTYRADPNTIYDTYHNKGMELKPITLTEEWLIKFGFNICKNHTTYSKIQLESRGFILRWCESLKGIYWEQINNPDGRFELKHLHQLQNLYHSLTGEELTIK